MIAPIRMLLASDWMSWVLWPQLEARIRATAFEITPETPPEVFIQELRIAFASGNPNIGIWVLIEPRDKGPAVRGHLIAWLDSAWGKNYLLVHQAHTDYPVPDLYDPMIMELKRFAGDINTRVNPKIHYIRWLAVRGDAWHRLLKKRTHFDRSTLLLPLSEAVVSHIGQDKEAG